MTGYENALHLLPPRLALAVEQSGLERGLWEIRLRKDAPLSLTVRGENICLDAWGRRCHPQRALVCTEEELQFVLEAATDISKSRGVNHCRHILSSQK